MSTVLIIGDFIEDYYRVGQPSRQCPEDRSMVILTDVKERRSAGGAGLVTAQFEALGVKVLPHYGSESIKERIYAGRKMVQRIDRDSIRINGTETEFLEGIFADISKADAIVYSDYNKGAITEELVKQVQNEMFSKQIIPTFADAKNNWGWYTEHHPPVTAIFPNENEAVNLATPTTNVIRKLGSRGCTVDGGVNVIPSISPEAVDVCGAGDIFLAAFVTRFLDPTDKYYSRFYDAAMFANKVAGISVQYVGTHVVTCKEIKEHDKQSRG